MFNYSFWADEAYISSIAMQLVRGKISLFAAFNTPGVTYQRLYMFIVSMFFRLFGVNEFVARLPSMIGYFIGIMIVFFLAKRLSNLYGGILASFIYAFSHLNLAYATQAKPYIIIEAIVLLVIYLLSDKKKINHVLIIILCSVATLLHSIGIFLWILYFVNIFLTFKHYKAAMSQRFIILAISILISIIIIPIVFAYFIRLFPHNNLYQAVKLFGYKYTLISVSATFGFMWLLKKNKVLMDNIACYVFFLIFFWNFYAFYNLRYLVPLFGIIFAFFGIFWAKVGERYEKNFKFQISNFKFNGKSIIPLMVIITIYMTGYKIIRLPQAYYNPNIDKYGDVQIANYKDFYSLLKKRFPDYKNLYVINDVSDVEYWYFGRYSNAYFLKGTTKPYQHQIVKHVTIYGLLSDFKKIIKDHPQGLLIMEDWQSLLPDDVKEYAKKNLKLEFRVESLKEAPDDPWPLALYSWGMNNVENVDNVK